MVDWYPKVYVRAIGEDGSCLLEHEWDTWAEARRDAWTLADQSMVPPGFDDLYAIDDSAWCDRNNR